MHGVFRAARDTISADPVPEIGSLPYYKCVRPIHVAFRTTPTKALLRKDGTATLCVSASLWVYEPERHHHVMTRVIFSSSKYIFRRHLVETSLAGACPAVSRSVCKKGPARRNNE
jgi:hypothetical protein